MKVLYVLWNYPQLSETYINAEIAFVIAQGISVEVWTEFPRNHELPVQCPVHSGSLQAAIAAVHPDLIHFHYLVQVDRYVQDLPADVPVTVRGHSFDWSVALALRIAELPMVKKIFLFPAFARRVPHPKITDLPVAYSTSRFQPASGKERRLVLRLSAELLTKGLADVFHVARLLPEYRFILGVARCGSPNGYGAREIGDMFRLLNTGNIVDLRVDLSWGEAAALTHQAGIYLHTADLNNLPYGMPISIAESLATGSLVLSRQAPEAAEMLGKAGRLYTCPEGAAAIILESATMSDEAWAGIRDEAVSRAQAFADTSVLPKLVAEWRLLTGK